MADDSLTVYRAGRFAKGTKPPWLMAAHEVATPSTRAWVEAISEELDCEVNLIAVRGGSIQEASVAWWTLPDGGHYAEFECLHQHVAAALIPDSCDWLGFYLHVVLPFLQGHATVALVHRQQRIGDVLIARARHGKGDHIDPITGTSEFDTHPRWNPRRQFAGGINHG